MNTIYIPRCRAYLCNKLQNKIMSWMPADTVVLATDKANVYGEGVDQVTLNMVTSFLNNRKGC